MSQKRTRSRLGMLVAAVGLVAGSFAMTQTPAQAAGILPTTTKVTRTANAYVVTVSVLGLPGGLGPITPKGTISFEWNNPFFGVAVGTVPLQSCTIILKTCTATIGFPAPPGTNFLVTYSGDNLAASSKGYYVVPFAPVG